ncbi:zf-HC2 domain-containing protein [Frankia nepalensis]|uniref:Zf-HC2 domain-containing protein n=1 Tax=Frankia nepalensis TaxID=1836974 RepID=A0A937URJ6_9ACTN|nr:zf-HC2 domain-containing protein [Frankia nepalensis]MBL7629310.1 zf-HC2 domain-containing protein [Frankia nepalensis]
MDCIICREALSARIDGEAEPMDPTAVDQHLSACAACRDWHDRAVSLTRSLRLGPVFPTPDFTAAVLDAHTDTDTHGDAGTHGDTDTHGDTGACGDIGTGSGARRPVVAAARRRPRRRPRPARRPGARPAASFSTTRLALLAVGWLQLGLGLLQLVDSQGLSGHAVTSHGTSAEHLLNESLAWNFAAGVGMLWAALQPRRAAGLLIALAGAILVLGGFSVYDLVVSSVRPTRVASHAVLLLGLGLAYLVDRAHQAGTPAPRHPSRHRPGSEPPVMPARQPVTVARRTRGGDTPLRPAGRRHAA